MKRVSFKAAKALKEAGYPQEGTNSHYTSYGDLVYYGIAGGTGFDVPTYLEVWLWLWREKGIYINILSILGKADVSIWTLDDMPIYKDIMTYSDPEEAIIAAIEYLVDNDLIK